ncbi:hypothetical protein ACLB2K_002967 [Fragaria x ananassa]
MDFIDLLSCWLVAAWTEIGIAELDFDMSHCVLVQLFCVLCHNNSSILLLFCLLGLYDDAYDSVGWWNLYGNNVPTLQKMAKRILALTTSSSGCERNWSAFEGIHTKKRNRLDTTRLNNLVYVQFNARILNKKRREKEKNVDVLIASEANMAQGWIVDGGDDDVVSDLPSERVGEESGVDGGLEPRIGPRIQEIRELDEDDFISDDHEEEIDDLSFDFESDSEGVQDGYGEEEFEA